MKVLVRSLQRGNPADGFQSQRRNGVTPLKSACTLRPRFLTGTVPPTSWRPLLSQPPGFAPGCCYPARACNRRNDPVWYSW